MKSAAWWQLGQLNQQQQLQFIGDFAEWLRDGQSADNALKGMQLLASEQRQQQQVQVIQHIRKALAQGKSVAFGMQGYFSQELWMLVEVGQQGGCLNELIARYQEFRQRRQQLLAQCKQGLLYPFILLSAALVAVIFVGSQIVPRFMQLDSINSTPPLVLALQQFATVLTGLLPIVALVVMALLVLLKVGVLTWHYQGRVYFPNFLPCALFRIYNGVYLLQGLSLLMSSQLSLERSLRLFEQNAGSYLRWHIQAMRKALARGEIGLHKVFATGFLNATSVFRLQASVAQQQPHHHILAQLSMRLAQDGEQLLRFHQRFIVRACYVLAILLIVWLVLAMGQLFTLLAQQLR